MIDKIGNTGKIYQTGQQQSVKSSEKPVALGADSVSISSEAVKAQEVAAANKQVKQTSDVRSERVKEVKEKLNRGDYDDLSAELLEKVADRIAQSLIG